MQILSALDAVSPAFSRTKLVLFSPFRKGRTWKLATTGYLAVAGTFFMPFTLIYLIFVPAARKAGGSLAVWALIGGVLLATAIYLYIFYLCSRIRFAFFDLVLNCGEFVAPAWRKYGPQSFKWTVFKVALGTILTAVLALPVAGYFKHIFAIVSTIRPGQRPTPGLVAGLFAGYAAFFLVYFCILVFFFASSLLSDFIVPSLALEDTTLAEAFRRLGALIRNEPGQFALYVALKLGLGTACYFGAVILFEILALVTMIVIGLAGWLIGYLLHLIGIPIIVLTVLAIVCATACYLFFFIYGLFITVGTAMTFLESYTLYFLAGRYPMLGDLLERSTPPPTVYMPPGYPPYYPPASPIEPQSSL